MDSPTHYSDVCQKALDVREKYNLTETQTLLYNHICRGDFKLRNEDGQLFYDKENNGFGWSGDREWVKKQFKPLIDKKLVAFKSLHDCRDAKYTSWYFYDPAFELENLIDASCYVRTHKLAHIKHYLKLPDGFEKKNKTYGDLELIYNKKNKGQPYTFKYKGEESVYHWDSSKIGKIYSNIDYVRHYSSFDDMIHDIWSFMVYHGCEYLNKIPGYTHKRKFTLEDYGVPSDIAHKPLIEEAKKEKEKHPDSFTLKINLLRKGVTHVFLNNQYFNSTVVDGERMYSSEDKLKKVEEQILEPLVKNTNLSYKKILQRTIKDSQAEVFEYLLSLKKEKGAYEKMKELFNENVGHENYYKNYYSIREIERERILSYCWSAHSSDKWDFNNSVAEQAKELEAYIEKTFGVKIKIQNIPTYNDLDYNGVGNSKIYFPYKIIRVVDADKLKPKGQIEEITEDSLRQKMLKLFIVKRNTWRGEEEKDVEFLQKPKGNIVLNEAISRLADYPEYFYILKEYEEDLLEDFENFKDLFIKHLNAKSNYPLSNMRVMNNFKKVLPQLYKKMFGDLPVCLLPVILYGDYTSQNLKDVVCNFKIPTSL